MEDFLDKILYDPVINKLVTIFIGIAVIWGLVKLAKRNLAGRINNAHARYRSRKFIAFAGYFFIIILVITVYSEQLGGVTVALGVAGAGIAFALQEVITSFAGWLAILFGNFYKTGDRVQLGGIKGDVIDIGVLRTTIMETGEWVNGDLYNGRIVLVANSFVFKEPVFNYSGNFSFLWDEITLPVNFGSNVSRTRQILTDAAHKVTVKFLERAVQEWSDMTRKYMIERARTEPMVTMEIKSGYMMFTLRYTVDYKQRRSTKDDLYMFIINEIDKTKGDVRLPQPTIEFVNNLGVKQAAE